MRPLQPLSLTDDERTKLQAWARRPKTSQRLALRARIILAAAEGNSNTDIADELGITLPSIGTWRQRFLDSRLDGLTDEPRPGAPRTITDVQMEQVVTQTLESKPKGDSWTTHCSLRNQRQRRIPPIRGRVPSTKTKFVTPG